MTSTSQPNALFWGIAVIALLWNVMGLFQFIMPLVNPELMLEGYNDASRALFYNLPTWYWIVFGIATITGFIAAIAQLLRKPVAVAVFFISMLAVFVVEAYWILATGAIEVMGITTIIMPFLVVVLSVVFYALSKRFARRGWLK